MMSFSRGLLFVLLHLFICTFSSLAQEPPTVGLSLDKHTGPILYKSLSKVDSLVATVSEDRTLKIWDYPSFRPVKSISMPETRGNLSRLGRCTILNKNIILVADDSGNDYEYRELTNSDKQSHQVQYGKDGASDVSRLANIKTTYCFYAVDWRHGAIVDRIGAMSSPITAFKLSTDESLLLVTSSGEEAMLYETTGLKLVSEFNYDDEEILGGTFISRDELVIITDLFYYKYKLRRHVNYVERKEIAKRRLRPYLGSKRVKRVVFNDEATIAYLFHQQGLLYAINLSTGVFDKNETPEGYEEYVRTPITVDSVTTSWGGVEKTVANDKKQQRRIKRFFGDVVRSYRLSDTIDNLFPDSLFVYRYHSAPLIQVVDDGVLIQYDDRDVWKFSNESSLHLASAQEVQSISALKSKQNTVYAKRGIIGSGYEDIIFMGRCIRNEKGLVYLPYDSEIPVVAKYGNEQYDQWQQTLPSSVQGIYQWLNSNHFMLSLNDGTLRWYNSLTGEEELALFISKEGEWIIWTPDGRYSQSSPKAGNMLEWRYHTFSRIEVRKPMDNRRVYCRPHAIESVIHQLYDSSIGHIELRKTYSLDDVTKIENVAVDDLGHYFINYTIKDYNPIQYGPYDVTVYLDDSLCTDFMHSASDNNGEIVAKSKPGAEWADIVLKTEYKGYLAPASSEIDNPVQIDSLWVTCLGINDYEHYSYPRLKAPVNDAHDVRDILLNNLTFGNAEWKDFSLLTNDEVSLTTFEKRLEDICSSSGRNTLSIVFYSGHGIVKNGAFYMVTSSGDLINLSEAIGRCATTEGNYLFIVDACYSGFLVDDKIDHVAVLTSSDAVSKSFDGRDELSESYFTGILKDQLRGIQSSGKKLDELFVDVVSNASSDMYIPLFYNNIGNIKIIRK